MVHDCANAETKRNRQTDADQYAQRHWLQG